MADAGGRQQPGKVSGMAAVMKGGGEAERAHLGCRNSGIGVH